MAISAKSASVYTCIKFVHLCDHKYLQKKSVIRIVSRNNYCEAGVPCRA